MGWTDTFNIWNAILYINPFDFYFRQADKVVKEGLDKYGAVTEQFFLYIKDLMKLWMDAYFY
jgi:hypothetical protein